MSNARLFVKVAVFLFTISAIIAPIEAMKWASLGAAGTSFLYWLAERWDED